MAKKKASKLTSAEAMNRIFGKGAAKQLRDVVKQEDAQKGKKRRAK